MRTLSQNCEQTPQKLRTNRIMNKRALRTQTEIMAYKPKKMRTNPHFECHTNQCVGGWGLLSPSSWAKLDQGRKEFRNVQQMFGKLRNSELPFNFSLKPVPCDVLFQPECPKPRKIYSNQLEVTFGGRPKVTTKWLRKWHFASFSSLLSYFLGYFGPAPQVTFETLVCKFSAPESNLRFPAGFLRKSAVLCALQMLEFPGERVNLRKSAFGALSLSLSLSP